MKKLLFNLLFIPLTLFSQETKKQNSEPVYKITTNEGQIIKAKKYRINKKTRNIDIQTINDKLVRFKSRDIVSIKQGKKEYLKKNNIERELNTFNNKFIKTISYDEIRKTPLLRYRNTLRTNEYINKDGVSFKVGDTIVIGKPSNNNNLEGSTLVKGATNNNFSYIGLGSGISMFMGGGLMANEMMIGNRGKIVEIKMFREGSKNLYKPFATLHRLNGSWLSFKRDAKINIDLAFESGEILKYGYITRAQAIAKLKEAKELLDLELIDREEYDAKKKKLSKFILKKANK